MAGSVASIFSAFPVAIIGVMLLFASLELAKFVLTVKRKFETALAIAIGVLSFLTNLGIGFFAGLIVFHLLRKVVLNHDGSPLSESE